MSLDVYLEGPVEQKHCHECGGKGYTLDADRYFDSNITHNLADMADAAGIYQALWEPDESGIEKAAQLVPILKDGLARLTSDPEHFRQFNPENGWGSYNGFVPWIKEYLKACENYPGAFVRVSR